MRLLFALLALAGLAPAQGVPGKGPPAHWRQPGLAHRTWGWQLQ